MSAAAPPRRRDEAEVFPLPTARLGLWVFLGVVTLLFAAVVSAYVVRRGLTDWRPLAEPPLLWWNTLALLSSSVALQAARRAARRGQGARLLRNWWVGGGLGVLFVLGQLAAWYQLRALGVYVRTNPSSSFFYLITALHGAHLVGGLVAWSRTAAQAGRGPTGAGLRLSVELGTVYWHFLLAVWLVLFGLMLWS